MKRPRAPLTPLPAREAMGVRGTAQKRMKRDEKTLDDAEAIARKLAVRLYWKLREAAQPNTAARMQGSPAHSVVGESLSSF